MATPVVDEVLTTFFTPGNVLWSDYWRSYDLVIAFHPTTKYNGWSVDVIGCDPKGGPLPGERLRNHCTYPDKLDRVVRWCVGIGVANA